MEHNRRNQQSPERAHQNTDDQKERHNSSDQNLTRKNVSRPRHDRIDDNNRNEFLRSSPDLYERGAE